MKKIDHIIFGCSDINEGIAIIHNKLGIDAPIAGRHPAFGTINALLSLGEGTYFEIIAPDPERKSKKIPDIFGLDQLKKPGLIGWMVKDNDPEKTIESLSKAGFQMGDLISGVRERPDGSIVSWQLTNPSIRLIEGFIPFLIQWGKQTIHPSQVTPKGCNLVDLQVFHPMAKRLNEVYRIINLPIEAVESEDAFFRASIDCPNGQIILE